MKETFSSIDDRLNNFDADKAAYEQQKWEHELTKEGMDGDFGDKDRQTLEEAKAYSDYMQGLAERDKDYTPFDDLENQPSVGFESEIDAAYAENDAFDAQKEQAAQDEKDHDIAINKALDDKFAANPKLRFMNNMAVEIAGLRDKEVTASSEQADTRRLGELEDRLQELLVEYSEQDDYDPAIADILIDENDTDALKKAAENAFAEQQKAQARRDAEVAAETEDNETSPAETPEDENESSDDSEPEKSRPSFDPDLAAEEARKRLDAHADNLEAAALERLKNSKVSEAGAEETPDDESTTDSGADRPVVKHQESSKEKADDANNDDNPELDDTHPARENESKEDYEKRHGTYDPDATVEMEPVTDSNETDDESNEKEADDAEKDTKKGRLARFGSWLKNVRHKGGIHIVKGYNKAKDGVEAIGGKMTVQREGELDNEYESRKRRTGAAAAFAGALAVSMLARYGFDHFGDGGNGAEHLTDGGSGTIAAPEQQEPTEMQETAAPTSETGDWTDEARTVEDGEGWNQTFEDMNIPQDEWGDLLQKAGPELEQNGYAYQMDNGSYGINRAGELPQEAMDIIERNR